MPLHWYSESETPITVHRSSWTDPAATFVGLKGGSPSGPHGQMDIGSFVLDADGVRWAVDLGAEGYHGIESRGMNLWSSSQNSDRWTIFRQSNHGHNTLVIDGQLQKAGATPRSSTSPTTRPSPTRSSTCRPSTRDRPVGPPRHRAGRRAQRADPGPAHRAEARQPSPLGNDHSRHARPGRHPAHRAEAGESAPGDDDPRTPVGRLEDHRHGQASQRVGLAQSGHLA